MHTRDRHLQWQHVQKGHLACSLAGMGLKFGGRGCQSILFMLTGKVGVRDGTEPMGNKEGQKGVGKVDVRKRGMGAVSGGSKIRSLGSTADWEARGEPKR